jgi:APA family basic amino acid/polyamine antiporter
MHAEHEQGELKKTLGPLNLILLGIGCIIGTGIFVLTGRAAAEFAGPGIMISFVITGTLCALVALSYAELASAIPVSGSAYSYSYASMGEIVAWVMGLLLVLEYGLAASTVAVGWSGYTSVCSRIWAYTSPPRCTAAPGVPVLDHDTGESDRVGVVNLPAIIGLDRGHLLAGGRHFGIGAGQQHRRVHQGRRRHRLHRDRRGLCEPDLWSRSSRNRSRRRRPART